MPGQRNLRRSVAKRWLRLLRLLRLLGLPLALAGDAGQRSGDAEAFTGYSRGLAQRGGSDAAILVAGQVVFSIDDIEGSPGQESPVTISLPAASELASSGAGPGAFILIRKIPPGVRLSAGMASGRLWVLPLQDITGLRLFAEPNFIIGDFVIEFTLVGPNNPQLAQQSVAVRLRPLEVSDRIGTAAARPIRSEQERAEQKAAPLSVQTKPKISPEEEAVLLKRGGDLLSQGGISAARIIFEELARRDSAKGALALGRSYDPAYVSKSRTAGLSPNLDTALVWYKRADELGSADARDRIAEIGTRR